MGLTHRHINTHIHAINYHISIFYWISEVDTFTQRHTHTYAQFVIFQCSLDQWGWHIETMSFSNILYYFDFSKFKLINNLRPRILCFLNINKFPLGLMMMALFIKRLFIIIPHYCQFTPLSKCSYHRKGKLWYKHRNMRCCRRWNFPLTRLSVCRSIGRLVGLFVGWMDGLS